MDQVHVLVPSLERQSAIAAALHAVEDEVDLLIKYATALRLQKKALMQRLFGGDAVAAKAAAE
jgi:restriction endonuclease S subunit